MGLLFFFASPTAAPLSLVRADLLDVMHALIRIRRRRVVTVHRVPCPQISSSYFRF